MKSFYTFIIFFFSYCFCDNVLAQPPIKSIKQPPKINGVLKATNSATSRAKIHANSNTVVGPSKSHPNYSKKKNNQAEVTKAKDVEAASATKKEKKRK